MTIFQNFTLKWWQAGLFKWGMLLLGITIGAYWPTFFSAYIPIIIAIAAVLLSYVTYVWLKQLKAN